MEKIKINNQVVLMRRHVKQAKVHVINKLVKEVKLLQNRKGNEEQVAKAKRKVERLFQEISILKKSKPDYVSKLALSKARDWKDILQQKNCTLEDRSIAMLANYDAVQKEVEKFHCTNPYLVSKIPDFIKEWEEKTKMLNESQYPFEHEKKKLNVNRNNKKNVSSTLTNFDKKNFPLSIQNLQDENKINSYKEGCELSFDTKEVKDIVNKKYEIKITGMNKHPNKSKEKYVIKDTEICSQKSEFPEANNLPTDILHDIIIDPSKGMNIEENTVTEENEFITPNIDNLGDNNDNSTEVEKLKKDITDSSSLEISVEKLTKRKISEDVDAEKNVSEASDSSDDDSNNSSDDKKTENILSDHFNPKITKKLKKENISENKLKYTTNNPNDKKTLNQIYLNQSVSSNESLQTENNLKIITVLNLNDLQGFDEIPIVEITESKNEIDEDKDSGKEMYDPFFLGRDKVNSVCEDMIDGKFSYIKSHVKHDNRSRKKDSIEENEVFNFCNMDKKDFQKHPNNSGLFGEKSYKCNNKNKFSIKRNSKKNYFQQAIQDRNKNNFLSKDQRNFNRKQQRCFLASEKKSSKSHYANKVISFLPKGKLQNEKANATSEKPLHPSWEAKNKMKELAQKPYQGKRIIFDD